MLLLISYFTFEINFIIRYIPYVMKSIPIYFKINSVMIPVKGKIINNDYICN